MIIYDIYFISISTMFTFHKLYFSANESYLIFFLNSWELNPYPCSVEGGLNIFYHESGISSLHWLRSLWKVKSSMALYAQDPKADLYRAFGAYMLGKPAAEVSADERQLAKVAQLGLGFGAGAATFQRVAKLMGGIELTFDQAEETTHKWRTEYAAIVDGWQTCHNALLDISSGKEKHIDPWGLTHTEKEGIRLPSGRLIRYPDLRKEENEEGKKEWVYARGRHQAKIYAGKIVENIVQSLARDSIFDCAIDFFVATGRRFRPALRVHDELVYVVPSSEAEALLAELQAAMARPPRWWPDLIVSSAGGIDQCYGAAK